MRSDSKTLEAPIPSTAERNTAALLLFGRSIFITTAVMFAALGFLAGIAIQHDNYDPYNYATGVGTLFAIACTAIAVLLQRRRAMRAKMQTLEARVEELADRNWELREAEERARSLLEAQGDLIVRRDAQGRVTYANDAFCALTGKQREALLGQTMALPALEQSAAAVLADGTRVYDQKIAQKRPLWRDGALDRLARGGRARRQRHRNPKRRPRRDRPHRNGARACRRARSGGSGQPRQVALPRHGQP